MRRSRGDAPSRRQGARCNDRTPAREGRTPFAWPALTMPAQPWWRAAFRQIVNLARATLQPPMSQRVLRSGRTYAGVYVNADEALKNATVWACIRYLSNTMAQTPWRVCRQDRNGGREIVANHPVDRLLNRRPSPDMGSFTFRQLMLGLALRYGNAYAEIEWDGRGAPAAIWPIHPDRVRVRRETDGRLVYDIAQPSSYYWGDSTPLPGATVTLEAEDVFHVRGFGEGPVGFNVITYAAQSIGWAQATEIFGSTYFGDGMNPAVVVTKPTKLTPEGYDELRRELKKLYEGPRGEKTFIADNGMTVEKLTTEPNDAQFIETRQHQVEEICRWFGVPPHKVMHLLRATFSNIEHQSIEVVVDSVTPWCKVFEEEADYKLFGANRTGLYTKMDLRGLLRGDSAARATFYKNLWQMGALSINGILALEDENGIGPNGDYRFVPANYVTLERAIAGLQFPGSPTDPEPPMSPEETEADRETLAGEEEPDPDADDAALPASSPAAWRKRLNGRLAGHA